MSQDPRLQKFQKLNETFEIAEKTLSDLEDDFEGALVEYTPQEDDSEELISIQMLKQDLFLIRSVLISNVQKGRLIIDAISRDIAADGGFSDSKMVEALSSLIKNTNSSLKELSAVFKDLHEIENGKKSKSPVVPNGSVNTQNNIFVGNAKDILDMLGKK